MDEIGVVVPKPQLVSGSIKLSSLYLQYNLIYIIYIYKS